MRFVLEIDCDGPAFKDDMRGQVADYLVSAAQQVLFGPLTNEFYACTWRFIAAPAADPDGCSSPDLGMVMTED
jgi:hypothetical protein